MNINEARLVSFVTSIVDAELDDYTINRLVNLAKACHSIQVEAERIKVDLKPLFDYMLNDRKIDAIKEHRQLTGAYLKEAKDEVERIMDRIRC